MEEMLEKDLRRLLRNFGAEVEHTIYSSAARHPEGGVMRVRITLEAVGDPGQAHSAEPVRVVVEDQIRWG